MEFHGYENGISLSNLTLVLIFSKKDIAELYTQINKQADEYFSKYQINNKEVSFFLKRLSLNPFRKLKDQIKSEHSNIS